MGVLRSKIRELCPQQLFQVVLGDGGHLDDHEAGGQGLVQLPGTGVLTWHYFVWQEIGLKLRHALIDILPYAVIAATVMAITYYSTRSIENIYLRLASKIVLAAALYVAAMWGSRSVTFKESIQYFIKKKTHEPQ